MKLKHLAILGSAACCTNAAAATLTAQQIIILGSTNVNATALNDAGAIAGIQGSEGGSTGFVSQGSVLWVLPGAYPSSINHSGVVAGFMASGETGFVWKAGSYNQAVHFRLQPQGTSLPDVLIDRAGEVAYTGYANPESPQVYAGAPAKPKLLKGLSPQFAMVTSMNDTGVIAGWERATVQGQQQQVAFVGRAGLFNLLLAPNENISSGGFVNDAGQVAFGGGSVAYSYTAGGQQPFTAIAMPIADAENVQVQGINNAGRIVGVFTESSTGTTLQHVFRGTSAGVQSYGSYGATDAVHGAISNTGAMVVSDTPSGGQSSTSFLVRCSGTGC
jgi:hypothetical protein